MISSINPKKSCRSLDGFTLIKNFTVSIVLVFILCFNFIVEGISFHDVKGHWAESSINEMAELNILDGYLDNTFRPENSITRAEFANILWKFYGAPQPKSIALFEDISVTDWYCAPVCSMAERGIIQGIGNKIFEPNRIITREETAVLISRGFGYKPQTLDAYKSYVDHESISDFARVAVGALYENGVMLGKENGYFMPSDNFIRCETATVFKRIVDIEKIEKPVEPGEPIIPRFDINGGSGSSSNKKKVISGAAELETIVVPLNTKYEEIVLPTTVDAICGTSSQSLEVIWDSSTYVHNKSNISTINGEFVNLKSNIENPNNIKAKIQIEVVGLNIDKTAEGTIYGDMEVTFNTNNKDAKIYYYTTTSVGGTVSDDAYKEIPQITAVGNNKILLSNVSNPEKELDVHIKIVKKDAAKKDVEGFNKTSNARAQMYDKFEETVSGVVYSVKTAQQFVNIQQRPYQNYNIVDLKNVDLTGVDWNPMGTLDEPYDFEFNGNGIKIVNVNVKNNNDLVGLFGNVGKKGVVKNLVVESINAPVVAKNQGVVSNVAVAISTVTGDYSGGVVAHNVGTIQNASANLVTVANAVYGGGAIGKNEGAVDKVVSSNISVSNSVYSGGVAGFTNSEIPSLNATEIVIQNAKFGGGIFGYAIGNMEKFTVRADVSNAEFAGAIAGFVEGNIAGGTTKGTVTNDTDKNMQSNAIGVGQLVGNIQDVTLTGDVSKADYVGVICGKIKGNITNCIANGNVQNGIVNVENIKSGVLVGDCEGDITNCKATGNVSDGSHLGVLAGNCVGNITNCKATGNVNNGVFSGVLVGNCVGGIFDCVSNGNVTGGSIAGGVLVGSCVGDIANSTAVGDVSTCKNGGILGGEVVGNIQNSSANGNVSDCEVGGILAGIFRGKSMEGTSFEPNNEINNIGVGGYYFGVSYGNIINVKIDKNISNGKTMGMIVGENYGEIAQCWVKGSIRGVTDFAGGVAGRNFGVIKDIFGNIDSIDSTGVAGGIVGENLKGNEGSGIVKNSYARNVVINANTCGGIAGKSSGTITGCCVTGGNFVSTLVYDAKRVATGSGIFTNNYSNRYVKINNYQINSGDGGLNNYHGETVNKELTQSEDMYLGGVGHLLNWDSSIWGFGEGYPYPYLIVFDKPTDWAPIGDVYTDPIPVRTVEEFVNIGKDLTRHYCLMNDINLAEIANFKPFEELTGSLDGKYNRIENLTISLDSQGNTSIGLFKSISGIDAFVKNIYFVGGDVLGYSTVGGVVGTLNSGTISGVIYQGTVRGNNINGANVGGIAGKILADGYVDSCYANVNLSQFSQNAGGITGYNDGNISNSYTSGEATKNVDLVGGITGTNGLSITNCYSKLNIKSGSEQIGGIVGKQLVTGSISNCLSLNPKIYASGMSGNCYGRISGDGVKYGAEPEKLIGLYNNNYASEDVVMYPSWEPNGIKILVSEAYNGNLKDAYGLSLLAKDTKIDPGTKNIDTYINLLKWDFNSKWATYPRYEYPVAKQLTPFLDKWAITMSSMHNINVAE